MKKILILALALMAIGASCTRNDEPQYADGSIKLAGREISMELAQTPADQSRGLSSRDAIEENQGMLFPFEVPFFPVFWMKDMRFSIDMIWIKGDEVVDISADVAPEPGVADSQLRTYSPKVPADRVLEVKTGWASRNGLKIGDKVEITQVIQ